MPERTFDENDLAALLRELTQEFIERDRLLTLWDALVLRERGQERETGQYVPPPFDKSKTILKHASGIIVDRAQFVAAKAAENPPNIKVFTIADGEGEPTKRALELARKQELCLNGIFWSADRRSRGSLQRRVAWSATTKGVGWYHSYRAQDGWKTADRRFFKDPSNEEIDRFRADGVILTEAFVDPPEEGMTHAETLESLGNRSAADRKQAAVDGEQLYIVENPSPDLIYWRDDTDGLSLVALIEEIPTSVLGDEWGVVDDGNRNIVIGRRPGGSPGQIVQQQGSWTLARVWTRTEYYYYISAGTGNSFAGNGRIVAHGFHKYGEVPFWPVSATETDSAKPEKRYLPAIFGALAVMPHFNQTLTLLSAAAIYNTTPRYVLIQPDGTPVIDDASGELIVFQSDTTVGLDPQFVTIIQGGGTFQQLKIENIDDLVKLLEFLSTSLDATLPSEAALGSSGASEPAWGTKLKQAAQSIKVQPLVDSNASAVERMSSMWSRDIRLSDMPVYIKTQPGKRKTAKNVRGLIELKPDDIVLDIGVDQDKRSLDERLQMTQIGVELLAGFHIDPLTFYEKFMGSDDPLGDYRKAVAGRAVTELLPLIIQTAIARVQGQLQLTPNEVQAEAEMAAGVANNGVGAAPVGEPAEAAGVRFPGQEMPLAGPPDQAGITTNVGGQRAGSEA